MSKRWFMAPWALAVVFWAGICMAEVPGTLDELIGVLRAEEGKLRTLSVRAQQWAEELDAETGEWRRTPLEAWVTAYYECTPGGRVRMDVEKEVLTWIDGAAPYTESAYSVAFDGKVYRSETKRVGAIGKTVQFREKQESTTRHHALGPGILKYATGIGFTTWMYRYDEGRTMAGELLAKVPNPETSKIPIRIEKTQWEGMDAVMLRLGEEGKVQEIWWFDPAKGYAFLAKQTTVTQKDGSTVIVLAEEVKKLVEAAPGVWYPVEAVYLVPSGGANEPRRRYVYKALKVVANGGEFDPKIFTLEAEGELGEWE